MSVSLRQMEHFVALAETLHFGRAAERLGIAQPPLSQSIRRLERSLGLSLLERGGRELSLTAAGAAFAEEARLAVAQAQRAEQAARRVDAGDAGVLKVGYVSGALFEVLPRAIRRHRKRCPDVRLQLEHLPTDEQIHRLRRGDLDLALVHPPLRNAQGLHVQVVAGDPLVAALPAGDPLARRRRLRVAALAGRSLIIFPQSQGPALYGSILNACRRAGFEPAEVIEIPRMHAILTFVAAGLGVALVQASARAMRIKGVRFVDLQPAPREVVWELAAVHDRRRPPPAVHGLMATLGAG